MSLINDALKRANQSQRKQPVAGPLGVPLQSTEAPRKPVMGPLLFIGASVVLAISVGAGLVVLGLRLFKSPPAPAEAQSGNVRQVASASAQPKVERREAPPASAPPVQAAQVSKPVPRESPVAAPKIAPTAIPGPEPPTVAKPAVPMSHSPEPARVPVSTVSSELAPQVPPPVVEPVQSAKATPTKPRPATESSPSQSGAAIARTNAGPASVVPVPVKTPFPEVRVTGIFYSTTRAAALVNGRKVNVGSTVTGLKVIAIERDSVTLEFEGETRVIYFQ